MSKNLMAVVCGVIFVYLVSSFVNAADLDEVFSDGVWGSVVVNFFVALLGGYLTLGIAKSDSVEPALALGVIVAVPNVAGIFNYGFEYGFDYLEYDVGYMVGDVMGALLGGVIYLARSRNISKNALFGTGKNRSLTGANHWHGGVAMDPKKSETTRYLAASAIQKGGLFRNKVLTYFKQKYKAFAPELGYDAETVVRLCQYFEAREQKYYVAFFVMGVLFLLTIGTILTPVIFLIAWIVRFMKGHTEHEMLLKYFQKDKFDPDIVAAKFDASLTPSLQSKIDFERQNLVIYDGFSPFVGAGINMGGWSFAVDISKPKEELGEKLAPQSFALSELYQAIDGLVRDLKFDGLKIRDVLFVNGSDLRQEKTILPHMFAAPRTEVESAWMDDYARQNNALIRYYKWVQVQDWGNELIVSYFLRYAIHGDKLFIEISAFLLTPLSEAYKGVDKLVPHDFRAYINQGVKYAVLTPFTVLYSAFMILGKIGWFVNEIFGLEDRAIRKLIKNNPLFNYGSGRSLRGDFCIQEYSHYFQLLDREMYTKIIEKEILDGLVEFLDDHNIDTSDLKERQTSILNQGIIVKGGDVKADSVAVGTGAGVQKTITRTLSAIGKK